MKMKDLKNNENIQLHTDENNKRVYKKGEIAFEFTPVIKVKGGKFYAFIKRIFDFSSSFLAIIVLSLFLLVIGILVKCTSRGPMIYKSLRVGKNGKIFNMYKFRTMYEGADMARERLDAINEVDGGVIFKIKNDPRITKFGKFLRRTSIDELPQLFNVLKGDLSLIGPRCFIPAEIGKMDNRALNRLLVPQGLSGEWQTHGRSNTTYEEMVNMDLNYIENKRGIFYDLKLVFLTVWVVITGKGAE